MAYLRRLSDSLNRAAIAFCVACVIAMLAISFIGFFYMMGTGEALSWTYSLARLFMPWIGMLSITIAFKGGEHVAMNLLLGLVPAGITRAMQWTSVALIGLFALLLLWFGWDFFLGSNQYYMVSDQIRIHGRWVAACMPVSGAILLVHLADGMRLLEAPPADLGSD